jgi:pre-mRNA-splicing factor 18
VRVHKYNLEQQSLEQQRFAKKLKLVNDHKESLKNSAVLTTVTKEIVDVPQELLDLTDEQVVERLRARNQPIIYFAESMLERLQRLTKLETEQPLKPEIESTIDKTLEKDAVVPNTTDTLETKAVTANTIKNDAITEIDTTIINVKLHESNPTLNASLVTIYLTRILQEWGEYLDARPDNEKRTAQGRLALSTQSQSAGFLKPFFKKLRKKTLPDEVVAIVTEICDLAQKREYMRANDAYVRLAIGNAAWPIGVAGASIFII